MIQELKAWISQLEAGKAWLEQDRQYWHEVAEERMKGISGLALRAAERLLPRGKRVEEVNSQKTGQQEESIAPSEAILPALDLWPAATDGENGPQKYRRPVSRAWGYDRGTPVDRYYIEKFLEQHSIDVQGCVLEIGDNFYTLRYGGTRVEKSEVLNDTGGNPLATIVADLNQADHLPAGQFDCIILTQTLHRSTSCAWRLNTLHRILKPGGVLLATFPGSPAPALASGQLLVLGSDQQFSKAVVREVFQPYNVAVVSFEMPSPPALSYTVFPLKNCARRTWNIATLNMIFLITVRAQKIGLTMQRWTI